MPHAGLVLELVAFSEDILVDYDAGMLDDGMREAVDAYLDHHPEAELRAVRYRRALRLGLDRGRLEAPHRGA